MDMPLIEDLGLQARDVARYFLSRAIPNGEPISPLKMQKLVYYAYCWVLVNDNKRLFTEPIEAWVNGPVVKSLYNELKDFGADPIPESWLGNNFRSDFFSPKVTRTLTEVYNNYVPLTAFSLVVMTHAEKPWQQARGNLKPTEPSSRPISDELILEEFLERKSRPANITTSVFA
jgi:uncharacterized phage-associated protein